MAEHENNTEMTGGIDRRSMLKRSAIVGGALVWTTPVVQSIGGAAFGVTPSEVPPDPQEICETGQVTDRYYFKADVSESGVVTLTTGAGAGGPQCLPDNLPGSTLTPPSLLSQITVTVNLAADSFMIVLPDGFSLVEADVKVGQGRGNPDPDAPDGCFDVDLTTDTDPDAGEYAFVLPDPTGNGTRDISNISVVFSGCVPATP